MGNLRVDFYDSGIGDTIIITFPGGSIGVVDGHPSKRANRPALLKLTEGKKIEFVCLTHPHKDHGADLVPLIEKHPSIGQFWHTISDVYTFVSCIKKARLFASSDFAKEIEQVIIDQAEFVIELFTQVRTRGIETRKLHSGLAFRVIDGVEIYFLSPDESVLNRFTDTYIKRLESPNTPTPDTNLLSSILALRFGENVVLLGADGLKETWRHAIQRYRENRLTKAILLKVPHHGAKNAIHLQSGIHTYLDLCASNLNAHAVILAGDSKHPSAQVYEKLRQKTNVYCTGNHPRAGPLKNPLRLRMRAHEVTQNQSPPSCNGSVRFEIGATGPVVLHEGLTCNQCLLAQCN